jgi:hypothetical protein
LAAVEENMESSTSPRIDNGGLVFGVILMGLGTLFTLDKLELLEAGEYWRYWPVLVIGFGVSLLLEPGRLRGGLWVLLYGIWQLAVSLEYLDFRQGLPLLVIGAGLILIGESLLKNGGRNLAEENHGR